MAQFLLAGDVDGVVNSRASASTSSQDLIAEFAGIGSESLDNLRLIVESHEEGFIFSAAENAEEKIVGGVLLELDAIANAVGSVEQHADAKRQIGLLC